jgi:segregation and condensation protein A
MAELQLELAGEYLLMAAMLAEIKSRMLLPRPPSADDSDDDDPRAELVRRLQEYERFKKAAEDIDQLARQERDTMPASIELEERKVVRMLPDVTLQEMLMAFKDVLTRAEKFAHHHISRERLSVRQRMSDILSSLQDVAFFDFSQLFKAQEGRMGVTVTFIAILELMKEGLIEIVQAEAYAPIHVRSAQGARHLKVVAGGAAAEADAENEAALAQPTLPDENELPEEEEPEVVIGEDSTVAAAVDEILVAEDILVDATVNGAGDVEETAQEVVVAEDGSIEAVIDEIVVADDVAIIEETVAEAGFLEEAAEEFIVADEVAIEEAVFDSGLVEEIAQAIVVAEDSSLETTTDSIVIADDVVIEDVADDAGLVEENLARVAGEEASEPTSEEPIVAETVITETMIPEHVVEEHVVPDNTVEEHVIEEHIVEEGVVAERTAEDIVAGDVSHDVVVEDEPTPETTESSELSSDDDSVTESSGGADNSDAEPSR